MVFEQVHYVELPKICDPRGNLSFIENGARLPFDIERVYWVYDVPGGRKRHGHAFRKQQELIIPLSGSFDVVLSDGKEERRYRMDRPNCGLYVPCMTWREIDNFATNSVALILSSTPYDSADYIEVFEEYVKELNNER